MDFPQELFFPQRTIFKKGASLHLAAECLEYGESGLIVHGSSFEKNGRKQNILKRFPSGAKIECFCRGAGEPDLSEVSLVIKKAKSAGARWIAGVGGGSSLDLAKAAAGLFHASREPVYYQEGGVLEEPGIPFLAVPTTVGSGSEATMNAVIINKEKKVKLSIRDKSFLARKVILDAGLVEGAPPEMIKHTALDAFVQAYESYISKNATWFSEVFALKSIEMINQNIIPGYEKPNEQNLSELLLGSYFAGIALSSSRLGVIHGIAHPLGALYEVPHGLICALFFLPSIKLNRSAVMKKFSIMSIAVGMDFQLRVEAILQALNVVNPFKRKKLAEKEKIIEETLKSGSTAANPKPVTRQDAEFLLKELFAL